MIKKISALVLCFVVLMTAGVFAKTLVTPKYDNAQGFNGLIAPVKVNGLYGFINRDGIMISEPVYTAVDMIGGGYFKVREGGKWGAVSNSGTKVVECLYEETSAVVSNGLWVVKRDGKWGAISMNGTSFVPCIYDYIGDFTGNIAPVSNGGFWTGSTGSKYKVYYGKNYGFVNSQGEVRISYKYEFAAPFKEGRARVKDANGWYFIDETDAKFGATYGEVYDFSEGLAAVMRDNKWGYIDINGNEVIAPTFFSASSFVGGVAVIGEMVDGVYKEGAIDKNGNILIAPKYDKIYDFADNAAVVSNGGYFGYIDKWGNEIVPVTLENKPLSFTEGVGLIKENGNDRFVNSRGEVVLALGADMLGEGAVSGGIALVSQGGRYGYVKVMPGEGVRVLLNGMLVKGDQPAIIINDRTMVPLRVISENIGAKVEWDEKERKVYITQGDTKIVTQIGNATMYKGESAIKLDSPPVIVNDRTLVPIRAIVEGLGARVQWDGENYTVLVTH